MFAWLQWNWCKLKACLVAPIWYHASDDGYVMCIYFNVTEMVDIYGTYILILLFVLLAVFKRNYLLNIFSANKLTVDTVKNYSNRTKLLSLVKSTYRNLTLKLSPISKKFDDKFKN